MFDRVPNTSHGQKTAFSFLKNLWNIQPEINAFDNLHDLSQQKANQLSANF